MEVLINRISSIMRLVTWPHYLTEQEKYDKFWITYRNASRFFSSLLFFLSCFFSLCILVAPFCFLPDAELLILSFGWFTSSSFNILNKIHQSIPAVLRLTPSPSQVFSCFLIPWVGHLKPRDHAFNYPWVNARGIWHPCGIGFSWVEGEHKNDVQFPYLFHNDQLLIKSGSKDTNFMWYTDFKAICQMIAFTKIFCLLKREDKEKYSRSAFLHLKVF